MKMKTTVVMLALFLGVASAGAADKEAHEKAEAAEAAKSASNLAGPLKEAKISLEKGIKASEKEGKPISAKFEIDEGKLLLSVYTVKGDKYFEVLVDHQSGAVTKTEAITSGEDLAEAKKQAEAMQKAKRSLREVVAKAQKANAGYKAVSVTAELEDGNSQADLVLLKGTESKQVEEKLQ
jgi:hypothetical protein